MHTQKPQYKTKDVVWVRPGRVTSMVSKMVLRLRTTTTTTTTATAATIPTRRDATRQRNHAVIGRDGTRGGTDAATAGWDGVGRRDDGCNRTWWCLWDGMSDGAVPRRRRQRCDSGQKRRHDRCVLWSAQRNEDVRRLDGGVKGDSNRRA